MSNKFGVAYAYGEEVDKVLVMNLSMNEIKIKKGTTVAEFHPRPRSDLTLLSRQETSCNSDYLSEGSRHLSEGPSNTSNSDYLSERSARTRGKGHRDDESIRGKNHLSEEGRDTAARARRARIFLLCCTDGKHWRWSFDYFCTMSLRVTDHQGGQHLDGIQRSPSDE